MCSVQGTEDVTAGRNHFFCFNIGIVIDCFNERDTEFETNSSIKYR
jgi:hypothetical protein